MVEEEYTVSGYRSTYLRTKTSSSTSRPVAICAIALLAYAVPPITKFILHAHFFVRAPICCSSVDVLFPFCSFPMVFSFYFYKKNSESMCAANVADTQLWQTERVLSDCKYTHIQVCTHPSHAYTQ